MPNKAALALLLLTAFAACAEAVTYRECDFGLDCAYNKTNLCSDGRQVFFDHDVKCCNCGYAPGCFGCTSSSSDCYSYSCPVESWISTWLPLQILVLQTLYSLQFCLFYA